MRGNYHSKCQIALPFLPEGSNLQVEILSVSLYVITSTFPIWGLQSILESCQTLHIKHHWKEDDIINDNDNDGRKKQKQRQRQRQKENAEKI